MWTHMLARIRNTQPVQIKVKWQHFDYNHLYSSLLQCCVNAVKSMFIQHIYKIQTFHSLCLFVYLSGFSFYFFWLFRSLSVSLALGFCTEPSGWHDLWRYPIVFYMHSSHNFEQRTTKNMKNCDWFMESNAKIDFDFEDYCSGLIRQNLLNIM